MKLLALMNKNPELSRRLHDDLPFLRGEVLWAVRHEMARNVEDVLARRVRALFLDARASIAMASEVAKIVATELNYNEEWIENQVKEYTKLARTYLLCDE
jgi:glycerol-3-phosphate dehydrogenase